MTADIIPNREMMVRILSHNDCKITFVKKDGTERVGRFTLREDALPKVTEVNDEATENVAPAKTRKQNLDVLTVWDLDKSAWRCFRVESVKEFAMIDNN